MPGIYKLTCRSCDYSVRGSLSRTTVVTVDGSEKICPHPCERRIAEETTGTTWAELVRANRIVYRYALVCLSCGALDYYGPRDLAAEARPGSHIGSIVHQPSRAEAAAHSCNACGARRLHPLCGQSGCLIGLLRLLGFFRERVACPKCHNGSLLSRLVATSYSPPNKPLQPTRVGRMQ